jgi:hypothetical protein
MTTADRRPSLDSGVVGFDRASSTSITEMSRRLSKTLSIRDGSKVLKITVDDAEPSTQSSPTEVVHSNATVGEQQIATPGGARPRRRGRGQSRENFQPRAPLGPSALESLHMCAY